MNVVIIVSDTLRWDYLGCYGNDWIQTPNLDALASESAVFLDAFAEGLPTIPARRVIMTGRNIVPSDYRPQPSDRVQIHGWHPLYDEDVTLAEHLRDAGFHTAFFNDVYHMMKPGKNFHRGFEQWFWVRGHESDGYALADRARIQHLLDKLFPGREIPDAAWLIRHLVLRETWQSDADTIVAQTMRQAADWVEDYSLDQPFYLHVEVFDPHEPWDPPADMARLYDPDYGDSLQGCLSAGSTEALTDKQFTEVKAAYAGEVTLVDKWTGVLLDALREKGVMDDTLVVFTADHGCMMGEQGQIHKGRDRLRNQCTQLPLLIRHPKGEAAGARVPGFCQHQDIMPTVLGILGESTPERVLGRDIWTQTAGGDGAPDYVVSAFGHWACIRTKDWNYVRPWTDAGIKQEMREDLYDLNADPQELTNVAADHPDICLEMAQRLEDHIKKFRPLTGGAFQQTKDPTADMSFDALPRLDAKAR